MRPNEFSAVTCGWLFYYGFAAVFQEWFSTFVWITLLSVTYRFFIIRGGCQNGFLALGFDVCGY